MKFNRKKPEKIPMYVYYIIAGIIIIILNMLVVPAVQERSVQKTDYSTFIENVEKGNVTKATVEESYIYYEMKADDTDGTVLCKTVKMDDASESFPCGESWRIYGLPDGCLRFLDAEKAAIWMPSS